MEQRAKILVLDERVYKGKMRLYTCVADGIGAVKIVGKGLSILSVYDVQMRKGRNLYYLLEYEPIRSYAYLLRNPVAIDALGYVYNVMMDSWPQGEDVYDRMLMFMDRLEREPKTTYEMLREKLTDNADIYDLLSIVVPWQKS